MQTTPTRNLPPGTFLSQTGSSTQSLQKPTANKDLMFLKLGQCPDVGLLPGPSSPFSQQQEFVADSCSFQVFLKGSRKEGEQRQQLSVPQTRHPRNKKHPSPASDGKNSRHLPKAHEQQSPGFHRQVAVNKLRRFGLRMHISHVSELNSRERNKG